LDISGQSQSLELPSGSLAYTFCQVPIILQPAKDARIEVFTKDGVRRVVQGNILDEVTSRSLFSRDGRVHHLHVFVVLQE